MPSLCRVFSKDEEGCIPADEMKFALMNLPGNVTGKEIDEMIETVDKNGDGKISFSEFRSARKRSRITRQWDLQRTPFFFIVY